MKSEATQPDVQTLLAQVQDLTAEVEVCRMVSMAARSSDNALIVTDRQGRVNWINPAFESLTGYTLADFKGRKPGELLQTRATDPATIAYIREQREQGLPFETDILNRRKDGTNYWAHIAGKPLRDNDGQIKWFMAIQRDVTALRRDQSRLSFHHEAIQLLSQAKDIDALIPQLLARMAHFIGWPVGLAWEVKTQRWVGDVNMICAHHWSGNALRYAGFLAASQRTTWQKGESLLGQVWEQGQRAFFPVMTEQLDPGRGKQAIKEGLSSSLVIPIRSGARVTYLLEFVAPCMQALDPESLDMLEGLCAQLSQFIDRCRDELRVRQFMTEFDCLFKLSPDGFVVFNTEGIRSYGNPAFYAMTGLTRERLDGVSETQFDEILASLCAPQDRPAPIGDIARDDNGDRLQLIVPKPAVLQRAVRDMYDSHGTYIGRAVYLRDITREMEVDRMKSEFLSTAAHELRTPMVSVHGFSELLLKRPFSEEKRRDIYETIHRQSKLLVNMVTELLDLARIESRAGKDFHIRPLDVATVVDQAVNALLIQGDTRPVHMHVPTSLPRVFADEDKLIRALTNLLSNAYKYSPAGGDIRLDVLARSHMGQPQLGIRVTDHGIGMTPEQLARVCERFYRADPSCNIPGTGLGMSLVKEIMTLMGGEVSLSSVAGEGTQATLWLRTVTDGYRA
ncbi:MAG TPA: ATP-binding protein [Aquabacterium sp.]|uniref:ATP-binding protein n=1 Tax=Aquabacterium sp. TaxID=1872578 RepID=UPI002E37C5A4|nr:ATP-binding protein [Aquabacterium sp.]HEX5354617.1 ATP-binding protein [Aquabacterium sp.]